MAMMAMCKTGLRMRVDHTYRILMNLKQCLLHTVRK
jgi:hypothetical protein